MQRYDTAHRIAQKYRIQFVNIHKVFLNTLRYRIYFGNDYQRDRELVLTVHMTFKKSERQ